MTTDNRANEPTPEQVEAAAKAIADCHNPGMFEKYPENWRVEARAALEAAARAAQGDAPQAERDWRLDVVPEPWIDLAPVLPSSTESPVEPFETWFACWWKNEPNVIAESNAQSAFYAGWDARWLPSSGVDVDALAEAWEAGCLAGKSREHHANMTEEQAEKAWPNPYRGGQVDERTRTMIKSLAEEYNIDEKALFNAVVNRFGFDYNREQAERVAKEMSNGA